MPATLSADVLNALATAVRDRCANGTLEIQTAADAVLATFGLSASAGTVSGAVWTLVFDAGTVSATGTGTAAKAVIKDSGGLVDVSGLTVSTSGADINLDNTSINSGQNVTLTSVTVTIS